MALIEETQADGLQFLARSMLANTRGDKKHDARIYWKRPLVDPQTGEADDAPGWIIWASGDAQSTAFMDSWMVVGRTPLPQYGYVDSDPHGPWGKILSHPKGPAEFPLEQILAYGWYDPNRCPVPGVKFPQLEGLKVTVYDCPECSNRQYQQPVHLARHLRTTHNWDWTDIAAYGEEQGIIFEKERNRGRRGRIVYDFSDANFAEELARAAEAEEVAEVAPAQAQVQHVKTNVRRAKRRGDLTPEQKEHARQALAKARAVRQANRMRQLAETQ